MNTAAKTPEQVKTEKAFTKLTEKIDLLNQCVNECEGSERESGIGRYARSVKRAVPSMRDCLIDCEIM